MAGEQQSSMIEALNKKFSEAIKARDFAALAGMFTDDAVMLPPRRNMIVGKNAIQSFWTQANRIEEVTFDTDSVAPLGGEVVREIGTLRMRVGRPGAPRGDQDAIGESAADATEAQSREILGKYVFLWRKINGEWKLETSIWNRNRPEAVGRRAWRRRAVE
jgi:uncharacterized protein (TIGR02246 family)